MKMECLHPVQIMAPYGKPSVLLFLQCPGVSDHTSCDKVEGLGSVTVHQTCALRLGIVRQAAHACTFCHATQCHEPKVHSVIE